MDYIQINKKIEKLLASLIIERQNLLEKITDLNVRIKELEQALQCNHPEESRFSEEGNLQIMFTRCNRCGYSWIT